MLPIRTILHPTDFSDRSGYALHLTCALARDHGARVVILHVTPRPILAFGEGVVPADPEFLAEEARQRLDALVVPDADLTVSRRSGEGDPAAAILREARELPADLIVMGTHGRTGLGRLLMGSVAEQVSRRAACPVLTVSAPFRPVEPAPAKESDMRVYEVMTKGAECTRPDATVQEAAVRMKNLDVGALPVCGDNDRLVGVLTDRDIAVRSVAEGHDPRSDRVKDVMTPGLVYCFADQDVREAADLMREKQVRRLPVLDRDKRLVGIVSLGDLAVETCDVKLAGTALEGISEP